MSTVIPIVQTMGTKQALRYAISDTTGRFWSGKAWATRQGDALLYATHEDATFDARLILLKQFRGCPVYQQFSVPLVLEVYSAAEVTPAEVTDFTRKMLKMSALYANCGTGPRPNALVLPSLKWSRMTQTVNSERDFDIDEKSERSPR